jgi:hypothetical protein
MTDKKGLKIWLIFLIKSSEKETIHVSSPQGGCKTELES